MIREKKNGIILIACALLIFGLFAFVSTKASAKDSDAKLSVSGNVRMCYKDDHKQFKKLKQLNIKKPGYLVFDIDCSIEERCSKDAIRIDVKGYDKKDNVIYSKQKKLKVKKDQFDIVDRIVFGYREKKIPAGRYEITLRYGSKKNEYEIGYLARYYKKTIRKIKLPKKITMETFEESDYKIKNSLNRYTFAYMRMLKISKKNIVDCSVSPNHGSISVYADSPGKCKITFVSMYGKKTTVTFVVKKPKWKKIKTINSDLDLDGRKEKVKIYANIHKKHFKFWTKLKIKINGKTKFVFDEKSFYGFGKNDVDIKVLKLTNGLKFLSISKTHFAGGPFVEGRILKFRNGKLKTVLRINKVSSRLLYVGDDSSRYVQSKGNTLLIKGVTINDNDIDDFIGLIDVPFRYNGSKFVRETNVYNVYGKDVPKLTTKKSVKLYQYPRGKRAGKIKPGVTFKISAVWQSLKKSSVFAYQVKSKNKKINGKWFKPKQCKKSFKDLY